MSYQSRGSMYFCKEQYDLLYIYFIPLYVLKSILK